MFTGLTERTKVLDRMLRISEDIGSNPGTAKRTGDNDDPRVSMVVPDPRGGGRGRDGASWSGPDARDALRLSTLLDDFRSDTLDSGRLRVLIVLRRSSCSTAAARLSPSCPGEAGRCERLLSLSPRSDSDASHM